MGGPTYQSAPPAYMQREHALLMMGTYYGIGDVAGIPTMSSNIASKEARNLRVSLLEALDAGSPYATLTVYDPSNDLDEVEMALSRLADGVDDFTPLTYWESLIDTVQTEADALFADDDSYITDRVNAFANRSEAAYMRSVNHVTGNMFSANAAEGSALVIGLALLERGRQAELTDVESELIRHNSSERGRFINTALGALTQLETVRFQSEFNLYSAFNDYYMRVILANREFTNEEAENVIRDYTYDLTLFQYPAAFLSALSGAPQLIPSPSKMQTALGYGFTATSMLLQAVPAIASVLR